MRVGRVLVIGESPSLGRAILDFLEADGFSVRLAYDPSSEGRPDEIAERYRVLVVASPGPYCDVARRWIRGDFPGLAMVVIGSRDPQLERIPELHRVPLPIDPQLLSTTVRRLATYDETRLERSPGGARVRSVPPPASEREPVQLDRSLFSPRVPIP